MGSLYESQAGLLLMRELGGTTVYRSLFRHKSFHVGWNISDILGPV